MTSSSPSDLAPVRITVLISGSGTNLQALIDASNTPALPNVQLVRVISDRKAAYGLTRAQNAHIPTTYHAWLSYKKQYPADDPSAPVQNSPARNAYDADLVPLILHDQPSIVVCAGFMRILTPSFLNPLAEKGVKIINLHPSLHKDLIGAGCIERAWEEFEQGKRTKTGIMIHYVIAEVDLGEPIVQQEVDIQGCGTLGDLQERIHQAEHGLIVEGTRRVVELSRGGT